MNLVYYPKTLRIRSGIVVFCLMIENSQSVHLEENELKKVVPAKVKQKTGSVVCSHLLIRVNNTMDVQQTVKLENCGVQRQVVGILIKNGDIVKRVTAMEQLMMTKNAPVILGIEVINVK